MHENQMQIAEKKLLRSVILLSYCGEQRKYEEIDQVVQQELKDYNIISSNLELYKVESSKIKKLIFKTFPEIEGDWNEKVELLEAYIDFRQIKGILDKFYDPKDTGGDKD